MPLFSKHPLQLRGEYVKLEDTPKKDCDQKQKQIIDHTSMTERNGENIQSHTQIVYILEKKEEAPFEISKQDPTG